ncbi:protein NUCLEOLAR COMPLEX ASSOCIATED 4-like isoform X2 [Tripterygium wilfordii]|uniref:protein NUCLEOLAR COMPLEX ASSOCIATED 4-like isoform X2 n=1 Tax=Tripterygium wilfordii TaxID=458696 RepID=UPI0018F83EEA|nr:protein NUCLEOLAR COMPLEX ASSOCIATED 4-like isoform X2 [Tripterygium wilfordii]
MAAASSPIFSKKQKRKRSKDTLFDLQTLGHQLLSSRAHINNLPLLLTFISPTSPPAHVLESLLSLQSFFTPLLPELPAASSVKILLKTPQSEDPELIYRTWLRSKFDEFMRLLIEVAVSEEAEDALKEVVFDTIMEFVKLGSGGRFNSSIYHRMVHSIVHSSAPVEYITDLLASKYFKYIDIRYFSYIFLEKIAKNLEAKEISAISSDVDAGRHSRERVELFIHKMHYIISHIAPIGVDEKTSLEMWSESELSSKQVAPKELSEPSKTEDKQLKSEKCNSNELSAATIAKKMKLKFTKAWLAFLRLPLPVNVLATLHQAVIPYLSNPVMLSDFLTRSYDIDGVVSVMALSSLFILITQHGLEYPNFYEKLYALLVPPIFMAKHRAKFFQIFISNLKLKSVSAIQTRNLLDSCLKSPLLPAYLAAAFAKKLSRLALTIPPSGSLVITALIHNLLRRHPSINCLVHQEYGSESTSDDGKSEKSVSSADDPGTGTCTSSRKHGVDHFNNEESNPMKCRAVRSSLWEIDTLRHHYCPPVSRFVLSLEEDLTVRAKTTEINIKDFCSGSYATIFGEEIRRRVKQVPLAFYKATPASLFSESDFPGWRFKLEESKDCDT